MTTSRPHARLIYSASESDANMLCAEQFFTPDPFHGTSHGLGLDVREGAGIKSRNHTILKTGHVVTVEPGRYYVEMGGGRLEEVALVTKTGCRNLDRFPKILEV